MNLNIVGPIEVIGEFKAAKARETTLKTESYVDQDISGFVAQQRSHAQSGDYTNLVTPEEHVDPVNNAETAQRDASGSITH
jgi:hypothetical protein